MKRESTTKMAPDSAKKTLRPVTIFMNCIGLFPVEGVTSPSADDLRFRWTSPKMISSLALIVYTIYVIHLGVRNMLRKPSYSTIGYHTYNLTAEN